MSCQCACHCVFNHASFPIVFYVFEPLYFIFVCFISRYLVALFIFVIFVEKPHLSKIQKYIIPITSRKCPRI